MPRRVRLAALVALVALPGLLLAACDWAQPRFGPARTGHNPGETRIGPAEVDRLTELWSAPIAPASSVVEPLVAGGRVFAAGQGEAGASSTLTAYDVRTGARLWSRTFEGQGTPEFFSPGITIAHATGTLVVARAFGTTIGELSGLDPATGATRWTSGTGWAFVDPVVSDGVVYAGYVDLLGGNVSGVAAVSDGSDPDGAAPGTVLWRSTNPTVQRPRVAVAHGRAYANLGDRVDVFDAAGAAGCRGGEAGGSPICRPQWTLPLGEGRTSSFPAVAGGAVYVAADDGVLRAFPAGGCGAPTCEPLWATAPLPSRPSAPAVAGGMVYVAASHGAVVAFPGDGRGPAVWTGSTGGGQGAPVVANGVVYLADDDGRLLAWAAGGCGAQECLARAAIPLGGPADGMPAVANGRIVVGAAGQVRAFGLPPDEADRLDRTERAEG